MFMNVDVDPCYGTAVYVE